MGHLSDKLKSFHLTTVIFGQVNRKIGEYRKSLFRMVKVAESSPKRSYKKVAINAKFSRSNVLRPVLQYFLYTFQI